jgi:Domain of unknown function (DUF6985)
LEKAMALFGLLRSPTFNDPVCGALVRSRGYWRGRITLGAQRDVPLLVAGRRDRPNAAALAQARELSARYPALQGTIGAALFEHYEPYQQAFEWGELDYEVVRLTSGAEVWPYVKAVHVMIAPLVVVVPPSRRLTVEIAYRTAWDIEHTVGAQLVDWRLLELNGSVLSRNLHRR